MVRTDSMKKYTLPVSVQHAHFLYSTNRSLNLIREVTDQFRGFGWAQIGHLTSLDDVDGAELCGGVGWTNKHKCFLTHLKRGQKSKLFTKTNQIRSIDPPRAPPSQEFRRGSLR